MIPLWNKGTTPNARMMQFTRGDDALYDQRLLPFDILGSIAHVLGLEHAQILEGQECAALVRSLRELFDLFRLGDLRMSPAHEDVHSLLEDALVTSLGEVGKKVHTGRSRNDQVLTALRLCMKAQVLRVSAQIEALVAVACEWAAASTTWFMPGYTHGQRAMPSSVGFWHACYAESWMDRLEDARGLWQRLDSSPLGAAAGFGVPLPLPRQHTAELLGFARVQVNAASVQNSRGRNEAAVLGWLSELALDIAKMSNDLWLYTTSEFDFVRLPEAFCTGSSLMPQKRNPDVLELLRAKQAVLLAARQEIDLVLLKLPSGYQRDYQLTKGPFFRGLDVAVSMLEMTEILLPALVWNTTRMCDACGPELYATHRAMSLVQQGLAFRDAYTQAANEHRAGILDGWISKPEDTQKELSHLGSVNEPGIAQVHERLLHFAGWRKETERTLVTRWAQLLDRSVELGALIV